jgi:hypothetical protein
LNIHSGYLLFAALAIGILVLGGLMLKFAAAVLRVEARSVIRCSAAIFICQVITVGLTIGLPKLDPTQQFAAKAVGFSLVFGVLLDAGWWKSGVLGLIFAALIWFRFGPVR